MSFVTPEISEKLSGTEVNKGLLHHLVVDLNARKRSGTHAVKTRAQVAGGGSKPWRQKGTGRARAGSNTSPVWVGGGVAHGPKTRKYGGRINRKEKTLGLLHALKSRLDSDTLKVFSAPQLEKPKTSEAAKLVKLAGIEHKNRCTVLVSADEDTLYKSFRNIGGCRVVTTDKANVVDLLSGKVLLVSEAGWNSINQKFEK